jgi:hypothetical protein
MKKIYFKKYLKNVLKLNSILEILEYNLINKELYNFLINIIYIELCNKIFNLVPNEYFNSDTSLYHLKF